MMNTCARRAYVSACVCRARMRARTHPSGAVRRVVGAHWAVKRTHADVAQQRHGDVVRRQRHAVVVERVRRRLAEAVDKVDAVAQPDGDDAAVQPAKQHALHQAHEHVVDLIQKIGENSTVCVCARRVNQIRFVGFVVARDARLLGCVLDTKSKKRMQQRHARKPATM